MLRRQKHALSQSTTPFACTLTKQSRRPGTEHKSTGGKKSAALLLTGGSLLLTVERFCLQLCVGVFYSQLEPFYLQLELFCLQLELFCLEWAIASVSKKASPKKGETKHTHTHTKKKRE